jgi:hypothetical protein
MGEDDLITPLIDDIEVLIYKVPCLVDSTAKLVDEVDREGLRLL